MQTVCTFEELAAVAQDVFLAIGVFDGVEFKEETKRRPCDVGPNFYATQSWHNTETGDGRRIQTASPASTTCA